MSGSQALLRSRGALPSTHTHAQPPTPHPVQSPDLLNAGSTSTKLKGPSCFLMEKEMATHSSILAWRSPWTEEPGKGAAVHGVAKSRTRLKRLSTHACTWFLIRTHASPLSKPQVCSDGHDFPPNPQPSGQPRGCSWEMQDHKKLFLGNSL